jgi:hypothetical protein
MDVAHIFTRRKQQNPPKAMKTSNPILRTFNTTLVCLALGAASAPALAQGPIPGTPAPQQGASRGGFGISLDLGSIFKAVQSLTQDDRYSSPDTAALPQYEIGQLIISYASADAAAAASAQVLIQASGGILLSRHTLSELGLTIVVLSYGSDPQAINALPALQTNPSITVSRHAIGYPMQAGTAVPGKQYAHELVKAPVQTGVKLSSQVTIGIIDTEVTNASSLSLANFKAKRMFADTDKPAVPDHGNAVAAIIAAAGNGFEGLAQGASLRAAGVMREISPGINATNTVMVAQALDWLISEKAQVVNLSLGSAPDAVLAAVIVRAQAVGTVVVAAAGNGGPQAAPSYPAAYPGVIAVTALDAQKRLYTRANRGAYVAIAAPGVDVWVPLATEGGKVKGKYMSGTSFASPFVAAAVAQNLAQAKAATPAATSAATLQKLCGKASSTGAAPAEMGCGLLQY